MKKRNSKGIIVIILGFIIGFICSVMARTFLPMLATGLKAETISTIAMLIQIVVSVIAVMLSALAMNSKK